MEKGDRVKIIDGSYAVRVDGFEEYSHIGLSEDVFQVIKEQYHSPLKSGSNTQVHDLFIKNTNNGRVYLHSKAFVRVVIDKPVVDPALIEALKLSIQQWQIMYDTAKRKREVYEFLGGSGEFSCFLCDKVRKNNNNRKGCEKCIDWKAQICDTDGSPYLAWLRDDSKENTLKMLNHIKSELVRLESLSK